MEKPPDQDLRKLGGQFEAPKIHSCWPNEQNLVVYLHYSIILLLVHSIFSPRQITTNFVTIELSRKNKEK